MPDQEDSRSASSDRGAGWLPAITGALLLALTFVFWRTLDLKEETDLRGKIQSEAMYGIKSSGKNGFAFAGSPGSPKAWRR